MRLLNIQAFSGIILFAAAVLAVATANSHFAHSYHNFFATPLPLNLPKFAVYQKMDFKMWIDDGLMAVFFLLVGLELKREIMIGELSSKSRMVLPFFAAVGGVILPILIYFLINFDEPQNLRGAAIPAATDIAFAIGIISLFGRKISNSLKIFLIALAIIDDIIAILIIAFFYSSNVDFYYLKYALFISAFLWCCNKSRIYSLIPYLLIFPFLWFCIFKSGIHPTISGVVLACFIPLNSNNNISPLKSLEHYLYLPVSYLILPIFAFANSGVVLSDISSEIFSDKIILGIVLGLFFGKQIGICLAVYLLQKFKICQFFKNASWLEFYGVAVIAGIGFTMSLFIGNLAFIDTNIVDRVRMGVILGSLLSSIFGLVILKIATINK